MPGPNYGGLLATPAGVAVALDYFIDGDFTTPQREGDPTQEFPFQNQGDNTTVILHQTCYQLIASYTPPDIGSPLDGQPNLYCIGDERFKEMGCGIWSFDRMHAVAPPQRVVLESHRYNFQTITSAGAQISTSGGAEGEPPGFSYTGPQYEIGSVPLTVPCQTIYDYFLAANIASYPLGLAPEFIKIGVNILKRGPGNLYVHNGVVCSADPYILAEDDTYHDWRGAVKYRLRRQIAAPTPAFWGLT